MTWLAETAMLAHGWRRVLMMLVAGAIAGLSVPPLFILPALFVALPVWVWALDGAEVRPGVLGRIFGPAFVIGLSFGIGYFAVAFHWIAGAFFIEGGAYVVLAPFAVLAIAAAAGFFFGLGSAAAHLLWSDGALRLLPFAGCLALAEWIRGHYVFGGFPYDLVGYALTANDQMAQAASLVGVYGLTLVAFLIGATPALIWPADGRTLVKRLVPFFVAIGVIAVQFGFGNIRLNTTTVTERSDMRLRLVQPVVTEHVDWATADPAAVIDRLLEITSERSGPNDPGLIGVSHIIWPESVFPFWLSDYPEALARIARMLPPGTVLLTGAPRESWNPEDEEDVRPPGPGYNAIVAIDTEGEIVASYDKSQLVPFGEYLPFQWFFNLFGIRQFVPGTDGWAPGDGRRLMTVPGTPPFIALICYEAIFPGDLGGDVEEAEFILNVTNDAWFDGTIGLAQHAHHARMRVVETGLPMVRVGNTGVTMVTDPLGRVTAHLAEGGVGILDTTLSEKVPATLFDRIGHWPFWIAVLGLIITGAITRRRPPRARA